MRSDNAADFWAKVDTSGECWLWQGHIDRDGYGKIGSRLAHRVAYTLTVGAIPEGLELDHVKARGCEHTHCVNPAHLEPVTPRVNTLRGNNRAAQNARRTHCIHGHEFTPDNTYIWRGHRSCRACNRAIGRVRQQRSKGRAA